MAFENFKTPFFKLKFKRIWMRLFLPVFLCNFHSSINELVLLEETKDETLIPYVQFPTSRERD